MQVNAAMTPVSCNTATHGRKRRRGRPAKAPTGLLQIKPCINAEKRAMSSTEQILVENLSFVNGQPSFVPTPHGRKKKPCDPIGMRVWATKRWHALKVAKTVRLGKTKCSRRIHFR